MRRRHWEGTRQGWYTVRHLNACESANAQHGNPASNLAEVLLRSGIRSAIAMAYKVVDEAVEIFTNVLYQSLLVNKLPIHSAARLLRLALLRDRKRRAAYMRTVQLLDYIVPVTYQLSPSHTEQSSKASLVRWSRGCLMTILVPRTPNLRILVCKTLQKLPQREVPSFFQFKINIACHTNHY